MALITGGDRSTRTAIVVNVHQDSVDVRVGGSSTLYRNIPVVGGTRGLNPGDIVSIEYFDGRLYAMGATPSQVAPRTAVFGAGGGGAGMMPHPMSYHTDENSWHAGLQPPNLHNPKAHASTHEEGGSDPIEIGMTELPLHADTHAPDGSDPIDFSEIGGIQPEDNVQWTGEHEFKGPFLVDNSDEEEQTHTYIKIGHYTSEFPANLSWDAEVMTLDAPFRPIDLIVERIQDVPPDVTHPGMMWLDISEGEEE